MKITRRTNRARAGFTLIEMIGVLAVIAILAALLIPKIFEAINNARVNNAAVNTQTVRTAIADHYAKFGGLTADPAGGQLDSDDYDRYDLVLMRGGFLDKPFAVKIAMEPDPVSPEDSTRVRLLPIDFDAEDPEPVDFDDGSYSLTGTGENDVFGSAVIEAILVGVTINDAKELNDRIDGLSLGSGSATGADTLGRVKYDEVTEDGVTTVYVYLTHR